MLWFLLLAAGAVEAPGAAGSDARAKQFIDRHLAAVRPLEIEVGLAWWQANVTGKEDDYRRKSEAETRLDLHLADPKNFAELKAVKQSGVKDPLLARQIDVLYLQYTAKQVEPDLLRKLIEQSNAVEQTFNVYRAKVDGKELTHNQVCRVLRESRDSAYRQAVWESSKRVGRAVEADLKKLVGLRNQAARKLGFRDYHVMQLQLDEQSQDDVLRLLDELDRLTREPFRAAKAQIDAAVAAHCALGVDALRPWHYHDPFFQQAPERLNKQWDSMYEAIDSVEACRQFYAGIALPVEDVLRRSDLFEKKGKCPHAFCTDIDREGDVRVLANVVPGREWLTTMLHELGHAVYSRNLPRSVPYVLRTASHALTTEGVAMMFDRLGSNADWLSAMGVTVPEAEQFTATVRLQRHQLLVFSRWCQVMFRFEKALYADPDQDLNRLWWDLVERYQELKRPAGRDEPDYAAKIHVVTAPAYYHNYMLGELFASQVHHAIARHVGTEPAKTVYVGNPAVGRFMDQRVFAPGRVLPWNELTRHATGEPLNVKAFVADLQGK